MTAKLPVFSPRCCLGAIAIFPFPCGRVSIFPGRHVSIFPGRHITPCENSQRNASALSLRRARQTFSSPSDLRGAFCQSRWNMSQQISPADIEAIAQRVVALLAERLATSQPATPLKDAPPSTDDKREITPRLAYTLKQLCAELSLSPVTIYRLEARGLLKSLPGIRRKIYSRAEVEKLLSSGTAKW